MGLTTSRLFLGLFIETGGFGVTIRGSPTCNWLSSTLFFVPYFTLTDICILGWFRKIFVGLSRDKFGYFLDDLDGPGFKRSLLTFYG